MDRYKDKKIIIDTDVGDEIDDALAIYYAMASGIEIVGVTTVFENTPQRSRIAKKLLCDFGCGYEKVPVYTGHGTPLGKSEREYKTLCQYSPELDREKYAPESTDPDVAVEFIVDSCRKYGEALTLVCLGPFTNIARAIERDPEALSLAGEIVIMGGAYFRQYADWNVSCDPEAAAVMFRSLDNLVCIGADVTHTLSIGQENYDRLLSLPEDNAPQAYISRLMRLWREENSDRCPVLHDPLVIAYVCDRAICSTELHPVAVVTDGIARGITLNLDEYTKAYMNPACQALDQNRRARVARSVKSEIVIEAFMRCFD